MVAKLGKHNFHYDTKKLFEPITKAVTDTGQKLLEETKSATKAIEDLDGSNVHVKVLELLNQNGLIDPSLVRPIAKTLVPTTRSQFRLYHDRYGNKWKD